MRKLANVQIRELNLLAKVRFIYKSRPKYIQWVAVSDHSTLRSWSRAFQQALGHQDLNICPIVKVFIIGGIFDFKGCDGHVP